MTLELARTAKIGLQIASDLQDIGHDLAGFFPVFPDLKKLSPTILNHLQAALVGHTDSAHQIATVLATQKLGNQQILLSFCNPRLAETERFRINRFFDGLMPFLGFAKRPICHREEPPPPSQDNHQPYFRTIWRDYPHLDNSQLIVRTKSCVEPKEKLELTCQLAFFQRIESNFGYRN